MKLASAVILLVASAFWFFRKEENIIPKMAAKPVVLEKVFQSPMIEVLESHNLKKTIRSLADLNNQIKKYEHLNYEEFNQDDVKVYNQLVFERALILKKQIFSKAARMGYYL